MKTLTHTRREVVEMGARGPKPGQTNLQQQVARLAQEPEYQLPDGSPNRSKIARELGCTRQAVQQVFVRLLPNQTTPTGKSDHWVDDDGEPLPGSLTEIQIEALRAAGKRVAEGWIKSCPEQAPFDPDYDFSGQGDWQEVRDAARAVGIQWEGTQPAASELRAQVWAAAQDGYRQALAQGRCQEGRALLDAPQPPEGGK